MFEPTTNFKKLQQPDPPDPPPAENKYVDFNTANKIARDAANDAANRAAELTAERFKNLNQQEDDGVLPIAFDKKTESSIVRNLFSTVIKKTTDQIMAPPEDPIRSALTQIGNVREMMEVLKGGSGGSSGTKGLIEMAVSQFALGLGNGLGQRGPEMADYVLSKFGGQQLVDKINQKVQESGPPSGPLSPHPNQALAPPGQNPNLNRNNNPDIAVDPPIDPFFNSNNPQNSPKQSGGKTDNKTPEEVLLTLDPNNPEHVSAYAETQGGISLDVARKMLMIHQDAFLTPEAQAEKHKKQKTHNSDIIPIPQHNQQSAPIVQPIQTGYNNSMEQQIHGVEHVEQQSVSVEQSQPVSVEQQVLIEQQPVSVEVEQQVSVDPVDQQTIQENRPENNQVDQNTILQLGQFMETVMDKMESLNKQVFNLQRELIEVKKGNVNNVNNVVTNEEKIEKKENRLKKQLSDKPINANIDAKWDNEDEKPPIEQVIENPIVLPIVEKVEKVIESVIEPPKVPIVEVIEPKIEPPDKTEVIPEIIAQEIKEEKANELEIDIKEITEETGEVKLDTEQELEIIETEEILEIPEQQPEQQEQSIDNNIDNNNIDNNQIQETPNRIGYRFIKTGDNEDKKDNDYKIGRKKKKGEKLEKRIIKGKAYQVLVEGNIIKEIFDEKKELLIPLEQFFK